MRGRNGCIARERGGGGREGVGERGGRRERGCEGVRERGGRERKMM